MLSTDHREALEILLTKLAHRDERLQRLCGQATLLHQQETANERQARLQRVAENAQKHSCATRTRCSQQLLTRQQYHGRS